MALRTLATLLGAVAAAAVAVVFAPPPEPATKPAREETTMTLPETIGALLANFTHRLATRRAPRPEELDEHALADIGIGAGEWPSIAAEARGEAPRTRRRIVEAGHA